MNGRAYYNEIDAGAAAWLRELIAAGHIADGDVDERSILDVRPDDVRGYTQCHWFAGIGGWSYALRLAGWPDERPVWTGSCPCQPFSAAGKGKAADDERHLWPVWLPLIAECRPERVFGEQVEAAIGWGWLDLVFADLETLGYACGSAVLPAAGVGAPHIRNRAWFVADAGDAERWTERRPVEDERDGSDAGRSQAHGLAGACSSVRVVAHANGGDASTEGLQRSGQHGQRPQDGRSGGGLLGHTNGQRLEGRADQGVDAQGRQGAERPTGLSGGRRTGFWSDAIWLPCTDGKARPTQPGIFPLAHGLSGRVGRLRGAGNAIVPEVAAQFIGAFLDHEAGLNGAS